MNYFEKYKKYKEKYNLLKGGEDNNLKQIHNQIKDYIYEKNSYPIYDFKDLPNKLKYEQINFTNKNCHLGQRKLVLTEIEFYNKFINYAYKNNIVIYAGSAPNEHMPIILKMFPNLKFILIDPNYHLIYDDYQYVYQNYSRISNKNHGYYIKQFNKTFSKRQKHLTNLGKSLKETKFIFDKDTHDILQIKDTKHQEKMDQIKEYFFSGKTDNLIDKIINSEDRIYIIQDYLDIDLTLLLKKHLQESKLDKKIFFLTDIRTSLVQDIMDIDIIYNNAQQMIYLKELQPDYSMLKFRPPFLLDQKETLEYFDKDTQIKEYFDFINKNYNIDFLQNYKEKKLFYFQNDFIFVQPWAPKGSTESRMFVSKKNINRDFINYDNQEWENKFFYFKFVRYFKFYPLFYQYLKDIPELHYDGCQDCAREIMILVAFIIKDQSKDYDLDFIAKNLNDKKIIEKLIKLYSLINKYIFFDLSTNNYKCSWHGDRVKQDKIKFSVDDEEYSM